MKRINGEEALQTLQDGEFLGEDDDMDEVFKNYDDSIKMSTRLKKYKIKRGINNMKKL